MKVALLILLILAGGAGIYFSLEQQDAFKNEIAQRRSLEDENTSRRKVLHNTEQDRHSAQETEKQWNTERGTKQALVDNETSKNESLVLELEETSKQFIAKRDEYQKIQDELEKYDFRDPQEVVDRKEAAEAKGKELLASNEEMNTLVEGVAQKVGQLESQLGVMQKRQAEYRQRLIGNGREYQITAVDPQWGFVVVNAGEDNHLTPQSVLMVSRDGKSIAKLKISSIEKRQTVADVVEGSLADGNRLQVGDHVILVTPQG